MDPRVGTLPFKKSNNFAITKGTTWLPWNCNQTDSRGNVISITHLSDCSLDLSGDMVGTVHQMSCYHDVEQCYNR